MDKSQVSAERKQLIVKSNDIIQKTRYHLTIQQQKLILYLISKIRPNDTEFKEYVFDLKNICQILNISIDGTNYRRLKDSLKKIADTSFWLEIDGKDRLYRWIDDIEINRNETEIRIKLDEDLKPFLLQLKESFTYYQLENVLCFNSKYSVRLYELFKSNEFKSSLLISVEDLKRYLMVENKYDRFTLFKTNVLNKAIEEINRYTDLDVDYVLKRKNRIIIDIEFIIYRSMMNQRINQENRNVKLGVIDNE